MIEHHYSSKICNLSQERLEHEAMVAINGPEVVHCGNVVKDALKMYWATSRREGNKEGHWVRRSEHIKSYTYSKAGDSLVNK